MKKSKRTFMNRKIEQPAAYNADEINPVCDSGNKSPFSDSNLQVLAFGSTGTGKTRSFMLPYFQNFLYSDTFGRIRDLKGKRCKQLKKLLKQRGK